MSSSPTFPCRASTASTRWSACGDHPRDQGHHADDASERGLCAPRAPGRRIGLRGEAFGAVRAGDGNPRRLQGKTFITPALAGEVLQEMERGPRQSEDVPGSLTPAPGRSSSSWRKAIPPRRLPMRWRSRRAPSRFRKYQMMEALGLHGRRQAHPFRNDTSIVTI